MEDERFIRVILPLKLAWEPCYRISEEVRTGLRVNVTFAGRKYTAVISAVDVTPDVDPGRIIPVNAVERHLEPIGEKELALWRFLADYYLCTIGEVYKMAYPAVKTAGETVRARAEERRELLLARTEELYRKRLRSLEERLAGKEEALSRRHNAKVTAELEAGRDRIKAGIEELRGKLEALQMIEKDKPEDDFIRQERNAIPDGSKDLQAESKEVLDAFKEGRTVLLQGGNARVAMLLEAARRTLAEGKDALMLVPEIALSRQLQATLRAAFGEALLVFHSAETAGNRRETATALRRNDRPRIVLGTRSAVFLPFKSLGLVIVEEEHDTAYKQDGTPRYSARDTAVMLGSIHGAHVLLSSPTPSLESLYNCLIGRYRMVRTPLEEGGLEIVDTSVEARKRGMVGDLSRILIARIGETLAQGGRVLVLRPWGPFEDLQEQFEGLFPGQEGIGLATVHEARRMDLSDISLLALLNADILMDRNDFRADEKVMQTLEQFRGRLQGRMLVQTRQGGHPVWLQDGDYALRLLEERKAFRLPPYTRMVDVIVRDGNAGRLAKLSARLAEALRAFAPDGPFAPSRGREPAEDLRIIRILLPRDRRLPESKRKIADAIGDFEKSYKYTGHITLDVDPV